MHHLLATLLPGPNTELDRECLLKGSYSQAVIKEAAAQQGKGGVAPTLLVGDNREK